MKATTFSFWILWRKPIRGSLLSCCARAASGHAAAPPKTVMNSRRFMPVFPVLPTEGIAQPAALRNFDLAYVGLGSNSTDAVKAAWWIYVCFAPKADKVGDKAPGPLCAMNGHSAIRSPRRRARVGQAKSGNSVHTVAQGALEAGLEKSPKFLSSCAVGCSQKARK